MEASTFQHVARLIGDPVRATILWTLLDGRAYTATELALAADTSAQNMSMHLNKLVKANLLRVEKAGRHRYIRFARAEVAYAIEALSHLVEPVSLAPLKPARKIPEGLRYSRSCYDHLAGTAGVLITEALQQQKWLVRIDDKQFRLTAAGEPFFRHLEIDPLELKKQRRVLARACLDWSERKDHLAGALGAALFQQLIERQWIRRVGHSREVIFTAGGSKALYDLLGIRI